MRRLLLVVPLVLALLIGFTSADAQAPGNPPSPQAAGYELSWFTIDGGGWTYSSGGGYSLGGTIGQPDAGSLTGGGFTLAGGFWPGTAAPYRAFLPLVVRGY